MTFLSSSMHKTATHSAPSIMLAEWHKQLDITGFLKPAVSNYLCDSASP